MKKKERDCMDELEVAKTMLKEASDKMSQALKKKDFKQASVSQAMVETANKKLEHAQRALDRFQKEKSQVDCRKRQLFCSQSKLINDVKRQKRAGTSGEDGRE